MHLNPAEPHMSWFWDELKGQQSESQTPCYPPSAGTNRHLLFWGFDFNLISISSQNVAHPEPVAKPYLLSVSITATESAVKPALESVVKPAVKPAAKQPALPASEPWMISECMKQFESCCDLTNSQKKEACIMLRVTGDIINSHQ